VAAPIDVSTALSYSCNCFVARFAERFAPGELARALERSGLASRTGLVGPREAAGRIHPAAGSDANRLQALGEDGILITAAGLAAAYRTLAVNAGSPGLHAVVEGLEGAVEFGTAQLARVPGWKVAGKTGSATTAEGARIAWFAGFAPSRAPQVVVAVALEGRSGGADAAPIAARILEAYRAGRL
jgi:cell division protein FtsI/penicillin-binding protein 2